MASGVEHATGPGIHEVLAAINLIVVFGIFYVMGKKGILASLKTRSEDVRKKLFESKEELEKVTGQLNEVKSQLNDFEATKNSMFSDIKKDAEVLSAKIIDEANLNASKILESAKLTASGEARGAASDLRAALVRDALKETYSILSESKDKQAMLHKQLFDSLSSDVSNSDAKGAQN